MLVLLPFSSVPSTWTRLVFSASVNTRMSPLSSSPPRPPGRDSGCCRDRTEPTDVILSSSHSPLIKQRVQRPASISSLTEPQNPRLWSEFLSTDLKTLFSHPETEAQRIRKQRKPTFSWLKVCSLPENISSVSLAQLNLLYLQRVGKALSTQDWVLLKAYGGPCLARVNTGCCLTPEP